MGTELLCSEPLPCCLSLVVEPWALFRNPAMQLLICPSAKALITFPINQYSLLLPTNSSQSLSWMPPGHFQRHRSIGCSASHQDGFTMNHSVALTWHCLSPMRKHFREAVTNQKSVFNCAKQLAYGQSYPPSLLWMPWGDKTKGVGLK